MRFDILTIFPKMFEAYFGESIIRRACAKKRLDIRVHDLRRWSPDKKHKKVDDRPFGGGPGMVMMVTPFYRALKALRALKGKLPARDSAVRAVPGDGRHATGAPEPKTRPRVILLSAKGKRFTHADAVRLAKYKRVVLLCGRYEGVDERVAKHLADEEISIGDFVLTGGELPAMVIVDAVARHVPGVLGKAESLTEESHAEAGVTEYPQYTRPETFSPSRGVKWPVPKTLLSGDHKKIAEWRKAGKASRH